ncbi:DUF6907 domain-containing protein [Streptomyces xanthochromogenes]|uniref:DUF6907 domain-containing protein n=1 Tax=Streptomyces xanthochromogenes TaxID=67384 RepID=UPI002F405A37
MSIKTVTCPDWCDIEHGNDPPEDVFHRSVQARVGIPNAQVFLSSDSLQFVASLCLPEMPEPGEGTGFIVLDGGDLFGPYAELDVEHADQFIRDLKTFTARVQQMRDRISSRKEQQS